MGHQPVQQAFNRCRAILTTKGPKVCSKFSLPHLQHQQDREGGHQTLRENSSHMVLTADKGVALVVMDKSQYIDKCMALLDDTKVYKPCKDTTKKLHRDIQDTLQKLNREHGTNRLSWWSK